MNLNLFETTGPSLPDDIPTGTEVRIIVKRLTDVFHNRIVNVVGRYGSREYRCAYHGKHSTIELLYMRENLFHPDAKITNGTEEG